MCQESSCYDLLSRMYQASNRWDEALKLAHTKDRINLKRTYYEYARHLEGEGILKKKINYTFVFKIYIFFLGKTELALEMFEKCQTHHYDVPRMLFEDTVALQNYCTTSEDP